MKTASWCNTLQLTWTSGDEPDCHKHRRTLCWFDLACTRKRSNSWWWRPCKSSSLVSSSTKKQNHHQSRRKEPETVPNFSNTRCSGTEDYLDVTQIERLQSVRLLREDARLSLREDEEESKQEEGGDGDRHGIHRSQSRASWIDRRESNMQWPIGCSRNLVEKKWGRILREFMCKNTKKNICICGAHWGRGLGHRTTILNFLTILSCAVESRIRDIIIPPLHQASTRDLRWRVTFGNLF